MTQSQHAFRRVFLAALLAITACAPDLDLPQGQDRDGPVVSNAWPELLTSDMIAALRADDPEGTEALLASIAGLDRRAAALRLRAAGLAIPVLTDEERKTLTDATADQPH